MTALEITVEIPGEPVAQGRPRAFRRGAHLAMVDPAKSRSWKAYASGLYAAELERAGIAAPAFPPGCAVTAFITAVFPCPKSDHRKRDPRPSRPHVGRPDADNLAKSALDAACGLLFVDDAQVSRLIVQKVVGAQGEAPRVIVTVKRS